MNVDAQLSGDRAARRPGRFTLPAAIRQARVRVDEREYLISASYNLPDAVNIRFEAWERAERLAGPHSTITFFDGVLYGAVRMFCPHDSFPVDALPVGSPERTAAVKAHYRTQRERAERAILAAHPWIGEYRGDAGDLVIAANSAPSGVLS